MKSADKRPTMPRPAPRRDFMLEELLTHWPRLRSTEKAEIVCEVIEMLEKRGILYTREFWTNGQY